MFASDIPKSLEVKLNIQFRDSEYGFSQFRLTELETC